MSPPQGIEPERAEVSSGHFRAEDAKRPEPQSVAAGNAAIPAGGTISYQIAPFALYVKNLAGVGSLITRTEHHGNKTAYL